MSGDQQKKKASQQTAPGVAEAQGAAQVSHEADSGVEERSVPLIKELQEQNAQLQEQNAQLQDQLLRKAAEFENFRKRMFREREEGIKYANAALLSELLPIIDDFERAILSAGESRDFGALHEGVSMIERQMVSVLERNWGLKRFSAAGEPFDPRRHEAIAVQNSSEHADAIVLEDFQKGYTLHDRVLRPAKVKVSRLVGPAETEGKDRTSSK